MYMYSSSIFERSDTTGMAHTRVRIQSNQFCIQNWESRKHYRDAGEHQEKDLHHNSRAVLGFQRLALSELGGFSLIE